MENREERNRMCAFIRDINRLFEELFCINRESGAVYDIYFN